VSVAEFELIGIPFDGYGRVGYQAAAAAALRDAGLLGAFDPQLLAVVDDLDLPAPIPRRGAATGLINESALIAMTKR
jgi:arginase